MLPQIVTQATEILAMDADYLETRYEFEHQERRTILEREEVGTQQQIFQHAAYSNTSYRQIFYWKMAGRLPPLFY